MKKIREEDHSISQPQPLEVVTDGDLEEIKKDPHEKENYNDAGGNPQKKKPDEIKDEEWFKEYADNVDFDKVKISDLWKKWLKKKVEDTKSIEGAPCLTCPVEEDCGKPGDKYSPTNCKMLDDWITLDRKKKAYEWKIWLAKSAVSDKKGFFDRIRDRVRGDKRVEHPEFTPHHSDTAGPTSKLPKVQTDKYKPVDPDISLGGPQMRFNQQTPEKGGGRYDITAREGLTEEENERTGTVPKGRGGKGTPTKPRAPGDIGTGKMPSATGKPAKPKPKPWRGAVKRKSFFERMIVKKDKKWHCDLCNIELPNDDVAEQRKQRHSEFHTNEAVGTSKRPRNWTFGTARYTKKEDFSDYDAPEGDVMPDIKDTIPKPRPKPRAPAKKTPFERAQPKIEEKREVEKRPKFNESEWRKQNPGKMYAMEQKILHEKESYDEDKEPVKEQKRSPSKPWERFGRHKKLERARHKLYLAHRKQKLDEFKKRQSERAAEEPENEELEAHFSDSNKANYVERVGEAMKSNMFFFGGKVNRKTGKKAKLKPRTITLDEFTEKHNMIYRDKIAPLIGSVIGSIGRVAMGAMSGDQKEMGEGGKDIGEVGEIAQEEKQKQ